MAQGNNSSGFLPDLASGRPCARQGLKPQSLIKELVARKMNMKLSTRATGMYMSHLKPSKSVT